MLVALVAVALGFTAVPALAEPIHFTKLIEQLPAADAIAGFQRRKPEGSTTAAMGFHTTVVSAVYESRDDAEKTIRIQMTDGAPTQFVTMAYSALQQFSQESTEGYEKGVQIDGYQGIERYRNEEQEGTLTLVVGTVVVEITTTGLPAAMLRTVWKLIPAKALQTGAEAKQESAP